MVCWVHVGASWSILGRQPKPTPESKWGRPSVVQMRLEENIVATLPSPAPSPSSAQASCGEPNSRENIVATLPSPALAGQVLNAEAENLVSTVPSSALAGKPSEEKYVRSSLGEPMYERTSSSFASEVDPEACSCSGFTRSHAQMFRRRRLLMLVVTPWRS